VATHNQSDLKGLIDDDKGLSMKKRWVTITAMLILAINLSSAQLVEANTFIFKISFGNPSGLLYLLVISLIFLTIRYYSYAMEYQQRLKKLWQDESPLKS
jgi:hypothetical protein